MIVKEISPVQSSYTWHEMTFHTKWTPAANVILCFDVPGDVQSSVMDSLRNRTEAWDASNVCAPHAVVLEGILHLFERSVWAIRDEVRRIEKVKLLLYSLSDQQG